MDARDPTIYAVALGGLLVAAMTAPLLPARRAARIGPAEALRE